MILPFTTTAIRLVADFLIYILWFEDKTKVFEYFKANVKTDGFIDFVLEYFYGNVINNTDQM